MPDHSRHCTGVPNILYSATNNVGVMDVHGPPQTHEPVQIVFRRSLEMMSWSLIAVASERAIDSIVNRPPTNSEVVHDENGHSLSCK